MKRIVTVAAAACCVVAISFSAAAVQNDVIQNGDFTQNVTGWDVGTSDADHAVGVVDVDGKKCLQLKRLKAGTTTNAQQFNLHLKPQTLYKLSVTGKGDLPCALALRPQSTKDKDFFALFGSQWGVTNCELPASAEFTTDSLLFDSGLKADGGFLVLRLQGEQPGAYYVSSVSLTEIKSSVPEKDELVIAHIGDSVTATSYLPFLKRIDALLASAIAKDFPDLKVRNLNFGADGEYAKLLIDSGRYQKALKDNYQKIDIAVIRYGGNDVVFNVPMAETKKYMNQLCDNLEKDYPGIKILIGTGPYIEKSDQNKRYSPLWEMGRELAQQRKYPLIDIYKRFEQEHSAKTAKADGDMHPSAFGVSLAAEEEYKALKPLLESIKDGAK
jgi:lysophospholipase L1-like esterase